LRCWLVRPSVRCLVWNCLLAGLRDWIFGLSVIFLNGWLVGWFVRSFVHSLVGR